MSLTTRTAGAAWWTVLFQILHQGYGFLIIVVLARLLQPADFGLVGMATFFTGFLAMFENLGIGTALVQRKEIDEIDLDSAFWGLVAFGLVLFAASALAAPLVGRAFNEPRVPPLFTASAFGFVLSAAVAVPSAVLNRGLRFREIGIARLSGMVPASLVGFWMAYSGWGAWSIVAYSLSAYPFRGVTAFLYARWRPRLRFDRARFRDLLGFGLTVSADGVAAYANTNLDFFFVGRWLGAETLGFYTLAWRLMEFPRTKLSEIVSRVALPAFAQIQHEDERMRAGYRKLVHYVTLATFPAMVGIFIYASEIIEILYGTGWQRSVPLLRILCWAGLARTVGNTVGPVILAKGRPDYTLRVNLVLLACYIAAYPFAVRHGAQGIAWTISALSLPVVAVVAAMACRLIGLPAREFFAALGAPFLGAVAMGIAVFVLRDFMVSAGIRPGLVLGAGVAAGVAMYALLQWAFNRDRIRRGWRIATGRDG